LIHSLHHTSSFMYLVYHLFLNNSVVTSIKKAAFATQDFIELTRQLVRSISI